MLQGLYAFFILQHAYNPKPNDKGKTVSFIPNSQLKRRIARRPPIKLANKLYNPKPSYNNKQNKFTADWSFVT
jgi:hypothetical protein